MGTTQEDPTLKELVSRLAELEQVYARLQEKLESSSGTAPTAKPLRPGVFASDVAGTPAVSASGTNGADGVDATSDSGTGVSASSGSGTGLLAKSSSGLAGHFMGNVQMENNLTVSTLKSGAGTFASNTASTPAVSATGINGVDGVDASSDSGIGVSAKSGSGTALVATSSSGLAGHFVGNVSMDNNLNVAGTLTGAVSAFASSVSGTPAVTASGTNGADGVFGSSDDGVGVQGTSISGGVGVQGNSTSTSGIGVQGISITNQMGAGIGVLGSCDFGPGVKGINLTSGGTGVLGTSFDGSGVGVQGDSTTGTGVLGTSDNGFAVQGLCRTGEGVLGSGDKNGVHGDSTHGNGVFGQSFIADLLHAGIHGLNNTSGGLAGLFDGTVQVNGNFSATGTDSFGSSPGGTGVLSAFSPGLPGTGVHGTGGTSTGTGSPGGTDVHGTGGISTGFGGSTGLAGLFDGDVQVNGNFTATGTKAFVQAHPTDPSREIVYVALEGGEAGTYVRGSGRLQSGKAVLTLPEHFALVTANEGLTIQLTPRGARLQLYVVELDTTQLVVREAQGKSGRFDYFICGVRRGYEQHEVIRTKN